ncbi:hypothetical protein SAMN05216223_12397 [Actinacidiphila yanglinensis]|uniref:Uncharacterized protein n=1 Tax=Actinacidiphila yanglinensis TaxID=310779 RepID=A0A1H6E2M6_9ACTN|nr:hypothetical protein [Actinacidiphila yanglinensis]SEG91374.1 hypothetical protein SAMN05216223_12397 [Actinacidiphila yanglinensis]
MDVLVPDDPVFHARFQSLEEVFLRRLHRFQGAQGPESEDERMLLDAYDSWVRILVELPHWSHRPRRGDATREPRGKEDEDRTTDGIIPSGRTTYTLYGSRGDRLTSLYPVEVNAADLGCLTACVDLLTAAGPERVPPVAPLAATVPPQQPDALADVLRGVVQVLRLCPPHRLLRALRHVVPRGPVVSVTLSPAQDVEYRRFTEQFVTVLSAADPAAHTGHRSVHP